MEGKPRVGLLLILHYRASHWVALLYVYSSVSDPTRNRTYVPFTIRYPPVTDGGRGGKARLDSYSSNNLAGDVLP
jgi:hypothetical protein